MLDQVRPENLIVVDIETVPAARHYEELDESFRELWEEKVGKRRPEDVEAGEYYFDQAGIFAEFGKVICIAVGLFVPDRGSYQFRTKSFYGHDEKEVLQRFADLLDRHYINTDKFALCGHNIKEFDVPYLCRRMLIHGIKLPAQLDLGGKKPWEIKHIDTMEQWKFGDRKNYTSLKLLAALFDIPTPKQDIDGSQVGRVYWEDQDLERISEYCSRDVLACAQLVLRYKGLSLIREEDITFTN